MNWLPGQLALVCHNGHGRGTMDLRLGWQEDCCSKLRAGTILTVATVQGGDGYLNGALTWLTFTDRLPGPWVADERFCNLGLETLPGGVIAATKKPLPPSQRRFPERPWWTAEDGEWR